MIQEIKVMLGAAVANFTDAQISLALKQAMAEVQAYCNRELDYELEIVAERIAVIKLNRTNSEGLSGQSYSSVSENYIDGYPSDIMAILDRKRRRVIKVV